jgi:hypothetical protein
MATIVIAIARPKFPLGQMVITANAQARLDPEDVQQGLSRHAGGDWGEVCPEDARTNADALKHGDRLMSVYGKGEKRFWIITEWDRSITTVLMPEGAL